MDNIQRKVKIKRLNSNFPEGYSSFKISVNSVYMGKLMNSSFWLNGVAARRFFEKRSKDKIEGKFSAGLCNGTNNLIIFYQNVRGLCTKSNQLLVNVLNESYPDIMLTKTWLSDQHFDNEFFHVRYILTSSKKRGGGVFIAVLKKFNSKLISTFIEMREEVWVYLSLVTTR